MRAALATIAILASLAAAAPPSPAAAQASGARGHRIGVLSLGRAPARPIPAVFQARLTELGYTPGRNVAFETRFADEQLDRLPALAAELVSLRVDVIYTTGPAAVRAAMAATATIPILMVAGDPVRDGFVASLARPGGNVTGVSLNAYELTVKRLEILKAAAPRVSRVALLGNLATLPQTVAAVERSEREGIARALGLTVQLLDVRTGEDLETAFRAAVRDHVDGLIVPNDPVSSTHRARLMQLALQHRLPTVAEGRAFAEAGGLVSYAPDFVEVQQRIAGLADRILRGTRPADLPIEEPTRFELVINLKTAAALGVAVPQSLLARADHVIR